MTNMIHGFWFDDIAEEVEPFCKRLAEDSIKLDIVTTSSELTKIVKSKKMAKYSIGIFDLKLDNSDEDAFTIANRLLGYLAGASKPVYIPLGTVTAHRQLFNKEFADEKNNPFTFEYDKSTLVNGQFNNFKNSIKEYSAIFETNKKALKYNEENPLKVIENDLLKLYEVYFGFVEDLDDESIYIRLWNPKEIKYGTTRRYSIDALREYNINQINQHVRLSIFEIIIANKKTLVPFIEPIGNIDTSVRYIIDNSFDYRKFIS